MPAAALKTEHCREPSLADQLLGKGMNELDISLVLARLQDEHYQLDTTEFLADVLAPNRIQAIETFIWVHLKASFVGKVFALDPSFLKAHVDWGALGANCVSTMAWVACNYQRTRPDTGAVCVCGWAQCPLP